MRTVQTPLLAGAAMIVFAGFARAESPNTHTLTIHLPDGAVEEVRYSGDVPPEIYLRRGPAFGAPPFLYSAFGPDSPFAMLDRISQEMDRRAARLLEEAEAITARLKPPRAGEFIGELIEAHAQSLPAGVQSYSFVSSFSGNGVCARSVEITSMGEGKEPRVVSRSYGQCAGAPQEAPRNVFAPSSRTRRPQTIEASLREKQPATDAPATSLIQAAALRQ